MPTEPLLPPLFALFLMRCGFVMSHRHGALYLPLPGCFLPLGFVFAWLPGTHFSTSIFLCKLALFIKRWFWRPPFFPIRFPLFALPSSSFSFLLLLAVELLRVQTAVSEFPGESLPGRFLGPPYTEGQHLHGSGGGCMWRVCQRLHCELER